MTGGRLALSQAVIEKWDAVFRACSAEPRRQLIVSLLDAAPEEAVSLPDHAMSPTVPQDFDSLRVDLRHSHLPLLERQGFVEWQTDPFEATRGPRFDHVGVVFEALHRNADAFPEALVAGCQRLEIERECGQ